METIDVILITAAVVCAVIMIYGILDVRKDIRRVKRILEDNSKLLK